jgi:hypothetical protein
MKWGDAELDPIRREGCVAAIEWARMRSATGFDDLLKRPGTAPKKPCRTICCMFRRGEAVMDWSARFSWFSALRGQRSSRSGEADCADMGTAFGLDASVDAYAAPAPSERDMAPLSIPPLESRLIRRSGL